MTTHVLVGDGNGGTQLKEVNPPLRGGTPEMAAYLRERGLDHLLLPSELAANVDGS